MTDVDAARARYVTGEQQLIAAWRAPPIVVALGVSAALFGTYAVLTWIYDLPLRPTHDEHIVPIHDSAVDHYHVPVPTREVLRHLPAIRIEGDQHAG